MSIQVTDVEVARQLTEIRTHLNAASTLHCYKNDYTPIPDSAGGNFTEANFNGYASESLVGNWGAVTEAADGKWYIEATPVTFTKTAGGVDNTIYGWWIDDGTNVVMAERLATPIVITTDALPFRLTIRYTHEAKIQGCS